MTEITGGEHGKYTGAGTAECCTCGRTREEACGLEGGDRLEES